MFLTDVDEKLRKLVNTMFIMGMIKHYNDEPKADQPPKTENKKAIQKPEVMNASIRGLQLRVTPFIRRQIGMRRTQQFRNQNSSKDQSIHKLEA